MKISWYNILTKNSIRRFGKFSNKKIDQEIQDPYMDEYYDDEEGLANSNGDERND